MRRISYILFLCALLWALQAVAAPIYGLNHDQRIPGHYIVVFKDGENVAADVQALSLGAGSRDRFVYRYAIKGVAAVIPDARLRALAGDPRIAFIEADRRISLSATQTPATWGLDRIDQRDLPIDNNYNYTDSASSVHAYIIDTGINVTHVEFSGRASGAYSAINDGRGSADCHGHGTHVAGTVGGTTYGVAKGVQLYAVRVLDCQGSGTLSGVIAGIDWVTANHLPPAVANMSLGGGGSTALDNAVRNSIASGVTYVVAAGNNGADACAYSPARVTEAITVGASTSTDSRASYSNYGNCLDLFAPGSGITSAWVGSDTATNTISGTSMATPHVTGIAALYLAGHPAAGAAQVSNALTGSASSGRLSGAGNGSPNLLAYSILTDDAGGFACPDGYDIYTGSLSATGAYQYQPNGTYYYSGPGQHSALLDGVAGTDFDLYLWKWSSTYGWVTVGSSTDPDSSERVDYAGTSGYYVWRVYSYSGSGAYNFCLSHP